jgi:outer membrane lipoprotein SlyB
MKKVALILASLLAIMLAGCGEGSSSAGVTTDEKIDSNVVETTTNEVDGVKVVPSDEVTSTSVTEEYTNEYGLNQSLGRPPQLPAS